MQYHKIPDNEASIINDIGRCASCHQPGLSGDDEVLFGLQPSALRQLQDIAPIEPTPGAKVDIFDAGIGEAQLGRGSGEFRFLQLTVGHSSYQSLGQLFVR